MRSAGRSHRSPNVLSLRRLWITSASVTQFACTELDRLAGSVGDLLEIVARLEAKKVSLRVLSGSQPLDPVTATGS